MSWQVVWFFTAPILAAIGMGVGTFVIIHLDERPPRKRKR